MQVELISRGLTSEIEYPLKVKYKNAIVGDYQADLLVEEKVIIELKVAKEYNRSDETQLLNELKATEIEVGLLINFGREKVQFERFVF